jgi:alcohol dehydrogenase class IV
MRFEFTTAAQIIFGTGTLKELGPIAASVGKNALLVAGRSTQPIDAVLSASGITAHLFPVMTEPTTDLVRQGIQLAREAHCDMVIGFGGGSSVDTAKAIAAMLTNEGDLLDYLEIVGKGKKLEKHPAPWFAVPTTAGTGAEVTRNAVILSPENHVKVSLRSPLMHPLVALIDPELTYSLPPAVTASTGLDALTQVIEPYVSHKANPMTDSVCREGMVRAARSLRRAYDKPEDAAAREDMAVTSLFGGLALANAGLGAAHGFAGPMGGMYPAPHGTICACVLPAVMEVNVRALKERMPESVALARYDEVAQLLTGKASAKAADAVLWIKELCAYLQVPPLRTLGVTQTDFPLVVQKASAASSMKGNPLKLTPEELTEILEKSF